MKKREIYACQELGLAEKYLFMWINDYAKKHKKISLRQNDIAQAISTDRRNVQRAIKSLIEKGFLKLIVHRSTYKCNDYEILK